MSYIHVYKNNFFIITDDQNQPKEKFSKSAWDWKGFVRVNNEKIKRLIDGIGVKGNYIHKYTQEGEPIVYHASGSQSRTVEQPQLSNRIKMIPSGELKASLSLITNSKNYSKDVSEKETKKDITKIKKMASSVIRNFLKS